MKKLSLIICALLPLFLSAQQVARSLRATNGVTIGFYHYRPADYSTFTGKYPVIIFLHGIGERGNGTTELSLVKRQAIPKYIDKGHKMRFTYNGKTESFIVLSPQLSKSYGDWQTFYVEEMIKYALKDPKVDPNRIILTGMSLGGGGVWQYASATATNAGKLAAIAPVCGTCRMTNAANITGTNLPIWAFHAKDDNIVTASCTINAINAINALNPTVKPKFTLYASGGHSIWDRAYDTLHRYQTPNIYEWFLSQRNGANAALPNYAPVAKAGANQTITLPTNSVTLNGSTSTDSDGSIASYSWSKISGPTSFKITGPAASITTVTGLVQGTYIFRLKATDNKGSYGTDDITVVVNSATTTTNKLPVAKAGANKAVYLPTNKVYLTASGSADADGSIVSYAWSKISGPSGGTVANPGAWGTYMTSLVQGTYTFRLTVTDNRGAKATDDVVVAVYGSSSNITSTSNQAPIARLGFYSTTVKLPSNTVYVNGSGSSDADGRIVAYGWKQISGPANAYIAAPYSPYTLIKNLVAGTYVFRFTIKDNLNATAYKDVKVVVGSSTTSSQSMISTNTMEELATKPTDTRVAKEGLHLFPNPVSSNLTVQVNTEATGTATASIFDVSGKIVRKITFEKASGLSQQQINVSDLTPGIYHLEVVVDGKTRMVSKFMKQ